MRKRKYQTLQNLLPFDCDERLYLPSDEYAQVMSEFNTHMSDEDRSHRIVTKAIGNYWYTIINKGFNDYTIIRKTPLGDGEVYVEWEDLQ